LKVKKRAPGDWVLNGYTRAITSVRGHDQAEIEPCPRFNFKLLTFNSAITTKPDTAPHPPVLKEDTRCAP